MKRFLIRATSLFILIAGIVSLRNLFSVPFRASTVQAVPVTVADIYDNPRWYLERPLVFEGQVYQSVYLHWAGAYQLVDDSGYAIWVLTTKFPPVEGSKVAVKGVLKPVYKVFSSNGVVFREISLSLLRGLQDVDPDHIKTTSFPPSAFPNDT